MKSEQRVLEWVPGAFSLPVLTISKQLEFQYFKNFAALSTGNDFSTQEWNFILDYNFFFKKNFFTHKFQHIAVGILSTGVLPCYVL